MDTRDIITNIIKQILLLKGITVVDNLDNMSLYQDGVGLDSMDTAELSARLEIALGSDPYSQGQFPRTLSQLVKFYMPGLTVDDCR